MFRRLFAPLAALLLLGACATGGEPVDPNDTSLSVVYGHIDMDEAPSGLDWVFLMDYSGDEDGYRFGAEDGIFYHVGVEPGPYQIDTFGANPSFFDNTYYTYNFGGSGRNASAVRIERPGVYYLGAHRYVDVDTGWFEAPRFDIEPATGVSEREILTWVLQDMEATLPEYVNQIGMVRRRLAEMG